MAGLVGKPVQPPPVFQPRSLLPKGVAQTPKGDIGAHRGMEAKKIGTFKGGTTVKAASYFKGMQKSW